MRVSLRTSLAAFVLSAAFAGAAAPSFANGFYQGIDSHHPPGTQNTGSMFVPMVERPYYVDRSVYVDPAPTGSIYVHPAPMGTIYVEPVPMRRFSGSPSQLRERYENEYQGGGQGDYYQGIIPPAPVP
ncbi:hypothetical protein AU381_22845 [Sinorhizobium glycinis]|uniref:Uncharacterized protein n=1 Tax=Sinorhizobium glycinis TaxID=1472378 RepID=A0A178XT43_9HYPH|nr:hypothetical protein [Sinorhizobium glycinis]OAP38411.1 hypothetical protein AU381_22845 [Sinorhizobium glycinis]